MSNPLRASGSLILSNTHSKAGLLVRNKYRPRRNLHLGHVAPALAKCACFVGTHTPPIYVLAVGSRLHAYVVEWRQMDARVVQLSWI